MKMMIVVLHQKKFFMRIIKKPFLINIPLFSIVRIDHNKLFSTLYHRAEAQHTWCE